VQKQGTSGLNKLGAAFKKQSSPVPPIDIPQHEYLARGWDVNNNEWRSVLWPALDKDSRAAVYERTSPVWKIAQETMATNIQP
jgi:hypothetical protein